MRSKDDVCIDWGRRVLREKGHENWRIEWTPSESVEGIVIFKTKTIIIHWPIEKPAYWLMAHEIAHVVCEKSGHDSEYAHQLSYLIRDFFEPLVDF